MRHVTCLELLFSDSTTGSDEANIGSVQIGAFSMERCVGLGKLELELLNSGQGLTLLRSRIFVMLFLIMCLLRPGHGRVRFYQALSGEWVLGML